MDYDISSFQSFWNKKLKQEEIAIVKRKESMMIAVRQCATILFQDFSVKKVYLFGSLTTEKVIDFHSDIDLAVLGLEDRRYFEAYKELVKMLPQNINLDLITLESANDRIKNHILRTGQLIE